MNYISSRVEGEVVQLPQRLHVDGEAAAAPHALRHHRVATRLQVPAESGETAESRNPVLKVYLIDYT